MDPSPIDRAGGDSRRGPGRCADACGDGPRNPSRGVIPEESVEEAPVVAAAEPVDKPADKSMESSAPNRRRADCGGSRRRRHRRGRTIRRTTVDCRRAFGDSSGRARTGGRTREGLGVFTPAEAPATEIRPRAEGQASLDDERTEDAATPAPPPEPARPANPSGWLVSPQRAAQFEPPVPIHQPAPLPPPQPPRRCGRRRMPAVPSFSPTPVGACRNPSIRLRSCRPRHTEHRRALATPPTSRAAAESFRHAAEWSGEDKGRRRPRASRRVDRHIRTSRRCTCLPSDTVRSASGTASSTVEEEPRSFPWKLAAIAVAVAGIAIFVGRTYLPGRTAVPGEPGAQVEAPAATSPSTAASAT